MKVLCPFHEESTPSCDVRATYYKCYGCGKEGPIKDLEAAEVAVPKRNIMRFKPKEDLEASIKRIYSLPTKLIRGFLLPYDSTGYYIPYFDQQYYTKRLWNPPKPADKYRGPAGHRKPLLLLGNNDSKMLTVIEGQLNAMSWYVCTGTTAASPGSATDLNREDFVKYYLQYESICIIVDKDPAGALAGINLRDTLLKHGKRVALIALPRDLNDLYQEENGKEKVIEIWRQGCLALSGGV